MQVSIETTSGLERRLTVGVPADRVDGALISVCVKPLRMFVYRVSARQSAHARYEAALWRWRPPRGFG